MSDLDKLLDGAPLPASVGRCADLYNDVRALRLAMEKEVEPIHALETRIREDIIARLSKSDDTGAAGLRYRAQIVTKRTTRVLEWPVIWSWIRKNDRFDMLQKRLSEKAVADWQEQEQRVLPGCEVVNVPDVSITKI